MNMEEISLEDGGMFEVPRVYEGLRRQFIIPPFSVLRVQDGQWMRRKKEWLGLGIKSEIGRSRENLLQYNDACNRQQAEKGHRAYPKKWGTTFGSGAPGDLAKGFSQKQKIAPAGKDQFICSEKYNVSAGTSVFDLVLCELIYHWFCPKGGCVVDPFAGGSVRGVVASVLGLRYWGSELRSEQVDANRIQAEEIVQGRKPSWVCGDALEVLSESPEADLLFSCPPYGNLEVYSDLPNDLSSMEYGDFLVAYRAIIAAAVDRLRENRFACFVVGNFRDKAGFYHDLVGDTVRAFRKVGMGFYNDAILVVSVGSLPIRVRKQFQSSRKLGKTHQNVLVFYKGDPGMIREEFSHE
jgi:DNA modification methylase